MLRNRSQMIFAVLFALCGLIPTQTIAKPVVDAQTVLQICRSLLDRAPEEMPKLVSLEAKRNLFESYSGFAQRVEGCASAQAIGSLGMLPSNDFEVQHRQHESVWKFRTDDSLIIGIAIEKFRPVTLADDEEWREPSGRIPSRTTGAAIPPDPSGVDQNVVEFFYSTNRKQSTNSLYVEATPSASTYRELPTFSAHGWTAIGGYSGERDPNISFGAVRVRVPEGHRIGKLELPKNWEIFGVTFFSSEADPKKHFTIRSISRTDEATWIEALSSAENKKRALVFVHGFNTKFRDAVFRTAQLVWDLQFNGTAVLFSWPSRGEIADYFYDRDSALTSRAALLRVVDDLHKAGYEEIDVIAHSMGNLVAVDALSNTASTQSPTKIANLVMAAPDVDRDLFLQDIPNVAKVVSGLTLYASANDKALRLSKRVAGNIPRAGDVPVTGPIVIAPVSTIDASAIGEELFGLNHSSFAETRNILNDLKLLLEGRPAPRLTEIRGYPEPPLKATYFRYVP